MSSSALNLGQLGENLAADYLLQKGWTVLTRNFRCREGELDLVCQDGKFLVFVEVKTRSSRKKGEPGEAVTDRKKRRLWKAAARFLSAQKQWDRSCRFDLVSVLIKKDGTSELEHLEDILDAGDTFGRGHSSWQPW